MLDMLTALVTGDLSVGFGYAKSCIRRVVSWVRDNERVKQLSFCKFPAAVIQSPC